MPNGILRAGGHKERPPDYLRNSAIPAMHAQVQYEVGKLEFGTGTDFKVLKPSLKNAAGNKSSETINSSAFLAWMKWESPFGTIKVEGVWGENMADLLMLGGIAERDSSGGFCNIRVLSLWSELSGGSDHFEWGLFGGYSRNLGLAKPLSGELYGVGTDIHHLYRIAPRIGLKSGHTKIGVEVEYTAAKYGQVEQNSEVMNSHNIGLVANVRVLGYVLYKF